MKKTKQELLMDGIDVDLQLVLKQHNAIIAGGAITSVFKGVDINDYDVYFRTREDMNSFLKSDWCRSHYRTSSKKAMNFVDWGHKNKLVQVVTIRAYPTFDDLWKDFDFTVCMGAYDCAEDKFYLHPDFVYDNMSNTLNFNKDTAFPIVSLKRVDKYKSKGYSINLANLYKIAFAINNLKVESYEDLCEQLGGMYGEDMDDVFDEIKDEPFDINKALEHLDKKDIDSHQDFLSKVNIPYSFLVDLRIGAPIYKHVMENRIFFYNEFGEIFVVNANEKLWLEMLETSVHPIEKDINNSPLFPLRLMKYVKVNSIDGVEDQYYTSFYDKSFTYEEGKTYNDVYASSIPYVPFSTYSDRKNRAFVYCHIDKIEDLKIYHPDSGVVPVLPSHTICVNELTVDKIVPIKDGDAYPKGIDEHTSSFGAWNFESNKVESKKETSPIEITGMDDDWNLSSI